jgi:uncharacterized protein
VTLTDTGPLVALLDRRDARHSDCRAALRRLAAGPLLTTWPCFTEAMYLLGSVGGYSYQSALWKLRIDKRLVLHELTAAEADRMAEFMKIYADTSMDLADASIVITAETRSMSRVFTLDSDFRVYRLKTGQALEIIPWPEPGLDFCCSGAWGGGWPCQHVEVGAPLLSERPASWSLPGMPPVPSREEATKGHPPLRAWGSSKQLTDRPFFAVDEVDVLLFPRAPLFGPAWAGGVESRARHSTDDSLVCLYSITCRA